MITIRYRDPNELSPGLHAAAERHGRSTTVYLLPGLSAAQRRAALRRLRISAGRGYDPRLPTPQLALALAVDRVRTTIGRAGAVFRSHPAGSTVPVMVVSAGAIAFLALSAVSIRVIHPHASSSLSGAATGPAASAGPGGPISPAAAGLTGPGPPGLPGGLRGQPGSGSSSGALAPSGSGHHDKDNGNGANPNNGRGSSTGSDPASGGGTTLTGTAAPTPTPGGNPSTATNPAPANTASSAPAASATASKPSPAPTATKSGQGGALCVNVGPLGVCL
jgi:hypothetical protein